MSEPQKISFNSALLGKKSAVGTLGVFMQIFHLLLNFWVMMFMFKLGAVIKMEQFLFFIGT